MTSKAGEIYQALVNEFPDAMQSITALSQNQAGGKQFIVCDSCAFNFDLINNFGNSASGQKEKSPDALFLGGDTLYFVEFKEGKVVRDDVRAKIHEGITTLFQYAFNRKIVSREQFLDLSIKYAVIRRPAENRGTRHPTTLDSLKMTEDFYNLKNLEGLLLEETTVLSNPKLIFSRLNKFSNGAVTAIEVVSADQQSRERFHQA